MSLFGNKKKVDNFNTPISDDINNLDYNDDPYINDNLPNSFEDDMDAPWLESDNIRYLQDNKPEIFEIIMLLKGMTRNKEGKFVKSKSMPQIMSDEAISMVYRTLSSTLNKAISMADISKDETQKRTLSVIIPIILDLAQNQKNYNIKSENLSEIVIMIENLVAAHLSRSINRGEGKLLRGLYSRSENVHTNDSKQEKSGGLLRI